jgi:DNA-binding transcriptional ArsR family regulator
MEAEEDASFLMKSPRALSAHLKRFVPAFERTGIILEQSRTGHDRQRQWTIRRKAERLVVEEF